MRKIRLTAKTTFSNNPKIKKGMRKNFRLASMATMALFAIISCTKENFEDKTTPSDQNKEGYVTLSFTANVESTITKMGAMDNEGKFAWEGGEEIKVLYTGGSTTATATMENETVKLNVSVPEGTSEIWMVYPSSNGASLSEGQLEISMPAIQKGALNGLFVAKVNPTDGKANFYHPICYYKTVIDGDGSDITRMDIDLPGTVITATKIKLSFDASTGKPSVSAATGSNTTIQADFDGAGTYYIPIVPSEDAVAPGSLSFQCYRGSDLDQEKAGAYTYTKKALANSRASVINWASLPAKISNRYVTVSGNGSKTGSEANKWDEAALKSFLQTQAKDSVDGIRIHVAEGTYTLNNVWIKLCKAVKIYIEGEGAEKTFFDGGNSNVLFGQNKDNTPNEQTIVFKNICFQNGKRTAENAGVFYLKLGKLYFRNCLFRNNESIISNNKGGGGGVCNVYGSSFVEFKECKFYNNSAKKGGVLFMDGGATASFIDCEIGDGTSANKNSATDGGAIYLNHAKATVNIIGGKISGNTSVNNGGAIYINNAGATVNISNAELSGNMATGTGSYGIGGVIWSLGNINLDGCTFKNNSSNQASCIRNGSSSGVTKINGCVFSGNTQASRGTIQCATGSAIFLNRCAFYNNRSTTNNSWGYDIHGAVNLCANNCTFYNDNCTVTGNVIGINGYHSLLMTNSTVIEKGPLALLRIDNASGKQVFCNNILINTSGSTVFTSDASKTGTFLSNGHNAMSATNWSTFAAHSTDKTDCTGSTFTGSYNADSNVYLWTANTLGNFTKATKAEITGTMQNDFNITACGITSLGDDFYGWLDGMSTKGYEVDGRNQTRQNWWPGSYDK